METNYRSYQQVLNISVKPAAAAAAVAVSQVSTADSKHAKKITKPKKATLGNTARRTTSAIKRRTKTGCYTCRKRKKKCDEDKVNGKCQACTRNFLECCWPEAKLITAEPPMEMMDQSKLDATPTAELSLSSSSSAKNLAPIKKCHIKDLLASPPASPELPPVEANPYPSPRQSPLFKESQTRCSPLASYTDISLMSLPPLYNVNYKLQAKDSNVRGSSLEDNADASRDIRADNSHAAPPPPPPSYGSKFVITSFNSDKNLCDIRN
ncbi:uncharacterized protein LODBEIA_P14340 [Lodderomyces beijingensis]|uniref:Zn(2)-C6 fungal-type domain-containing protein n=1 Tax=Lodderomyces beijingensis TaxID=1775926 RepID=A0ABP0ZGB1_9ASCO